MKQIVDSDHSLAPLLERFTEITLLDSTTIGTTISLPASQRGVYPGGGGGREDAYGAAALKLQTELALISGAITPMEDA